MDHDREDEKECCGKGCGDDCCRAGRAGKANKAGEAEPEAEPDDGNAPRPDEADPAEAEAVAGEYRVSLVIQCSACGNTAPLYNPLAVMSGMQGQVVRVMCKCGKIVLAQPAQRIDIPDAQMVRAALGSQANQRPLIVKP